MRSSRSCAICTGCTLDSPLRASRGFSASSRWPETSKAYSRPVLRIAAPSASVLPPAPAQKSTTISPRLASVSSASSWLPSSCTSTSPRSEHAQPVAAPACRRTRRPQGEYGVGSASMPAAASAACTSSRLAFKRVDAQVQRRRLRSAPRPAARTRSAPSCSRSAPASQSGRLWRSLSGKRRAVDRRHLLQPLLLVRRRAPPAGTLPSPCQPSIARRRSSGAAAALRQVLEQQAPAQHRVGRLGQRMALARARARGAARKKADTTLSAGASKLQHLRASRSVAQLEQRGGMHGRCRASGLEQLLRRAVERGAPCRRSMRSRPSTNQRTASG